MSLLLYDKAISVSEKVDILLSKYKSLVERNQILEEENVALKYQLNTQQKEKKQLEETLVEASLVKTLSSDKAEGNNNEIKAKLASMIKKVDACIELINE